jgi:hypothetical protein
MCELAVPSLEANFLDLPQRDVAQMGAGGGATITVTR